MQDPGVYRSYSLKGLGKQKRYLVFSLYSYFLVRKYVEISHIHETSRTFTVNQHYIMLPIRMGNKHMNSFTPTA